MSQSNEQLAAELVELVSRVATELHPQRPTPRVTLDSDLDSEVGLDSLARVELGARVEDAFKVTLDEGTAFSARSPRDLLAAFISGGQVERLEVVPPTERAISQEQATPAHDANNLVDVLTWHCEANRDREHIRLFADNDSDKTLTYGQLYDKALGVAAGLAARGVESGQRVALMLPTGEDYFVAFYAALLAGLIPVPIYPPARRSQLEEHLRRQSSILRDASVSALITNDEAVVVARLLAAQIETLHTVSTVLQLTDVATAPAYRARGSELAFLQYTSGSTGDAKGVMLTHDNLLANVRADGLGLAVTSRDVFVSWLPLYHDMGLIGAWLGSLYHGIPLVIMSPLQFLSRPQRWLHAIHRYGGTLSAAPNFAYELCVRRIRDADLTGVDLSTWRQSLNGAEAIAPDTLRAFNERFAPFGLKRTTVLPVYGLAECAVGLTFSSLGREPVFDVIDRSALNTSGKAVPTDMAELEALEVVGCGYPLPLHEVRIVDDRDSEVPERIQGRVQFRGPSSTPGYFKASGKTRQLIRDGWHETGDLGYTAGGQLFITGRSKDLVIRAGRNIHPMELESAVSQCEGVRGGRVAAFGVPDTHSGTERLVLLVETRWRREADLEPLRNQINELGVSLAGGAPDDIVFAPPGTILRTSSGKVRRGACRDLYLNGQIGRGSRPAWIQIALLGVRGVVPQTKRLLRFLGERGWAWFAWLCLGAGGVTVFLSMLLPLKLTSRWYLAHTVAKNCFKLLGLPLYVDGRSNLPVDDPSQRRRRIFVANHQSYLDGFVLTAAMRQPVGFLVKAEIADIWPAKFVLQRLGASFIRRQNASHALTDLRATAESADNTASLFIFVEGTFTRNPGVLPFHLGAFVTACEMQADVYPIAINGTRSVLRDGTWAPRRGDIHVRIGPPMSAPIQASSNDAAPGWHEAISLRKLVRNWIVKNVDEPDLVNESNKPPNP